MKRNWLLVPLLASLALSACTAAGTNQPEDNVSSTSAAAVETATATATSVKVEKTEGTAAPVTEISPSAEATQNLSDVRCSKDATGSWSFKATVNNPGDTQRRYTVAVAVVVGAVALGHALITVDVPANATTPVVAENFAVSTDPGAVCEPVMSVEG